MSEKKNSSFTSILPMVLGLTLSLGVIIGYMLGDKSFSDDDVKTTANKFGEIVNYINQNYVDAIDVNDLSEEAYTSIMENLDPHSRYIPLQRQKEEQAALEKDFGGIGIEFNMVKDTIFILNVLYQGPAFKAGILSGDRIVSVNGQTIAGVGITNSGIFDVLKGEVGEDVKIGLTRRNIPGVFEVTITRKRIQQRSLNISYMINKTVGYIKLTKFSRDANVLFADAIEDLKKEGMKSLVIDLRGNSGGYLNEATEIVDLFLKKGETIVYTMGRDSSDKTYYRAEIKGSFEQGPLVVLIDEGSASASEIVAGALQDNDRALIIGRRSYGKGLVQTPIQLTDGSSIALTTSRYYTPSGRCIQKPYGEREDYYMEHLRRYDSGELFHEDSIKYADSLLFKTLKKGRKVYGGGGISPDVFVADDTTYRSTYFNRLFNQNLLIEFAIYHAQDNFKAIHNMGLPKFTQRYGISDLAITELANFAEEKGIMVNQEQLWRSKPLIINYIKAYAAKEVWDNMGFYRVLHTRDPYIAKALESFPTIEEVLE